MRGQGRLRGVWEWKLLVALLLLLLVLVMPLLGLAMLEGVSGEEGVCGGLLRVEEVGKRSAGRAVVPGAAVGCCTLWSLRYKKVLCGRYKKVLCSPYDTRKSTFHALWSLITYVQGWPKLYMCTVCDRMHGNFPAKNTVYIGLARTIYIRCIYGIFGRKIIKYTVIYGVYIRFWPALRIYVCMNGFGQPYM